MTTQTFNVTKTASIEITNAQIAQVRTLSRAKVMTLLALNESQARKVKDAVKSGDLVEVEVKADLEYKKVANKDKRNVRIAPMTAWLAEVLDEVVDGAMTAGEIYNKINDKYGKDQLPSLIPESNKKPVRNYISRKVIDALKFIGATQDGKGVKATWTLSK